MLSINSDLRVWERVRNTLGMYFAEGTAGQNAGRRPNAYGKENTNCQET